MKERFTVKREAARLAGDARLGRTPQLRARARRFRKEHPDLKDEQLAALLDALWHHSALGARTLSMELMRAWKKPVHLFERRDFERWRSSLCGWWDTDDLGLNLLGPWVASDQKKRLVYLTSLARSPHLWSRRLALVATVPINRGALGPTIPELTLRLVEGAKHECEPMIVKSISWALRELSKRHHALTATYLQRNASSLPALARREVLNKLRTGSKSGKAK